MAELGALSWAVISRPFYTQNSFRASLTRIFPNFLKKKQQNPIIYETVITISEAVFGPR